jgi:23S rRNA (cytosine1962-C5)-methyltransferase
LADANPVLRLKPGRDKSLRQRHPWIFSGAIATVEGSLERGGTVDVHTADGAFIARAAFSPESQIRARVWTFDAREAVDGAFIARRVARAVAARTPMLDQRHTGCRLIHGESDGLPGVIADRYADVVVLQLSSAGAERWRDAIVAALVEATAAACVYERSDADVRKLEGMAPHVGLAHGKLPGARHVRRRRDRLPRRCDRRPEDRVLSRPARQSRGGSRNRASCDVLNRLLLLRRVRARGARRRRGQRHLDRQLERRACARARELSSNPALPADRAEWREADVFAELRKMRDRGDGIRSDRRRSAEIRAHARARGARVARIQGREPLGAQAAASRRDCSRAFPVQAGSTPALFRKIVAGAALDASADAAVIGQFAAAADHPVSLAFPEGDYLKGLLVRKAR